MTFDFENVHTAGARHQATGARSRPPASGLDRTVIENDTPVLVTTQSNKQALNSSIINTANSSHAELDSALGNDPPILLEFAGEWRTDAYCIQVRQYIGIQRTDLTFQKKGLLEIEAPIGGAIQKAVVT